MSPASLAMLRKIDHAGVLAVERMPAAALQRLVNAGLVRREDGALPLEAREYGFRGYMLTLSGVRHLDRAGAAIRRGAIDAEPAVPARGARWG